MPNSRAIFSSSYRGRIGKTFWGGHYVDFLKRKRPSVAFKAFDPDLVNASLKTFHPETESVDISKPVELDRILNALEKHEVVFCDGLGGHYQSMADWIRDVNLFDLAKELKVKLTFVVLVTDNVDTIKHAGELLKSTPEEVDFLIVKNAQFSTTGIWEKTNIKKSFEGRGAREFTLPRNHPHIELLFDELKQPALTLAHTKGVQMGDRQRFLNLARRLDEEFEAASGMLLGGATKSGPIPLKA